MCCQFRRFAVLKRPHMGEPPVPTVLRLTGSIAEWESRVQVEMNRHWRKRTTSGPIQSTMLFAAADGR